MRKILVFGLLGILLTLGCPQIQKAQAKSETTTTCNFVGGPGLVITADVPYSQVYAGDTIDFTVHIENKGDAGATIEKVCIFGIDPNLIQEVRLNGKSVNAKPCADIRETLEKAQKVGTSTIPGGSVDIDITLNTPKDIKSKLEQPVSVYLIYDYNTYITGSLCIQNPYAKVKNTICRAGEISDLCQSGGPIKLNDIKAYVRKSGKDKAYVILTMTFTNAGSGKFFSESGYKTNVKITAKLHYGSKDITLACSPTEVPVTGSFTIRCRGYIDVSSKKESFNYGFFVPFEVELAYKYETTWSYTFRILPQLE